MRKQVTARLLGAAFATLLSFSASSQFNPPGAFEDTYPTPGPNIGLTDHTSAYSYQWVNTVLGNAELALAGWDEATPGSPGGVSWRLLLPGNPSVILNQGIIPYSNVRDLEVGYVNAAGDHQIVVAYYKNGSGHAVDVYSLATGSASYLYTTPLSGMPNYTRISIDCHKSYGIAIAWEDMGGIATVVGLNTNPITFSGVLTLSGTMGETSVDCAFSHSGPLNVQYVYYNPVTGNMTESAFDFWTAIYLGTSTIIPTVNDINFVGACKRKHGGGGQGETSVATAAAAVPPPAPTLCPYPNIDCPGHYNVDNWAYTYTTNNSDISVRLLDLNTVPFANTVIVNNGSSLPSMPINMTQNMHPFCAYDHNQCGPTGITVAWYTNFIDPMTGAQAGYVGLRMNENGTMLFSAPSYLTVANNPTLASQTPVLSISKEDDAFPYMYTVFPEFDPMMGGFQLENKYPPFCTNSFKGGQQQPGGSECNDEANISAFHARHAATAKISAHPNPFTNSFVLSLPASCQEGTAEIFVTNIMGVVSGKYSGPANMANSYLNALGKELPAGTYLLHVSIQGKVNETLKLVKVQ